MNVTNAKKKKKFGKFLVSTVDILYHLVVNYMVFKEEWWRQYRLHTVLSPVFLSVRAGLSRKRHHLW